MIDFQCVKESWYDPCYGCFYDIHKEDNRLSRALSADIWSDNDWILILEAE